MGDFFSFFFFLVASKVNGRPCGRVPDALIGRPHTWRFVAASISNGAVLPSFTEFYRVLPSFTEFYRVYLAVLCSPCEDFVKKNRNDWGNLKLVTSQETAVPSLTTTAKKKKPKSNKPPKSNKKKQAKKKKSKENGVVMQSNSEWTKKKEKGIRWRNLIG